MKKLNVILFISSLFFLNSLSYAQSDTSFFVGTIPLQNIEAQLIEVKFQGGSRNFAMIVDHGQECVRNFNLLRKRSIKNFKNECAGVKDWEENLLNFKDYLDGLNLLEEEGFELIEIVPFPESRILNNATFIFRRKSDQE